MFFLDWLRIEDTDASLVIESSVTNNDSHFKGIRYSTRIPHKLVASMDQTILYVGLDVDDKQ